MAGVQVLPLLLYSLRSNLFQLVFWSMMTSINSPKFPSLSKDFPKHESSYISSFKSPQQCNKRLPTAYSCYIHLPLYAILCHMLCPQGTRRAQSAGSAQCGWLAPNTLPAQAWWKSDSQRHTDYAYLGLTGQFSRKAVEMLYYTYVYKLNYSYKASRSQTPTSHYKTILKTRKQQPHPFLNLEFSTTTSNSVVCSVAYSLSYSEWTPTNIHGFVMWHYVIMFFMAKRALHSALI